MVNFRRRVIVAGAMLLALGAIRPVPARAQMEKTTLALPAVAMVFLSDYVAEDAHLYQKEGLDVKIDFIAGVGAFNAVVAGATDFSMSSGLTLNRAAAHGQRMLAIANTLDRLPMEIVLRKDVAEKIHFNPKAPLAVRAQALRGRTMGIDAINSVVHAYLRVIAKAGGYNPDAVTVSPLQPADLLSAFSRGAIDGFSQGPPWTQEVEAAGTAVVVANAIEGDPPGITPLAFNIVVTRPQYCRQNRSICVKMGHAMIAAAHFIHDHPKETVAFMEKRFKNVNAGAVERAYAEIRDATPLMPSVTKTELENADRLNVDAGLTKASDEVKSYDGLFTDAYLK